MNNIENVSSHIRMVKALASRLLATEQITAKEAIAYLRQPREGRGCQPLLRPWRAVEEPRAKRPRPADQAESTAIEGTATLASELVLATTYDL
jgi:hypothetical protein